MLLQLWGGAEGVGAGAQNQSHGANPQVSAGWAASGGFREDSVSHFFHPLEAARVPGHLAPSSIFKVSMVASSDLPDSEPPAFLFHL